MIYLENGGYSTINTNMANKCYIYKITNKINNKIYIGFTSKTINHRFNQHCSSAINNTDKNYFHKAIRKYGVNNFLVEELDSSSDRDYCLNVLEPYYIKLYDSQNPKIGYNQRGGGDCGPLSESLKKKLSNIMKEKYKRGELNTYKGISFDEKYGLEKSKQIKEKISKNHHNVSGSNNPFYHKKHPKEIMDIIKFKTAGKNNKKSKTFIVYNSQNEILYKGKGINEFSKSLGYNHTSSLKRCIKLNRPILTKHKTIYQGCYIKYVEED